MADLDPLIRVRKHAVEQKQKFLAELYRQAEEMAAQKTTLETQLEQEREKTEVMDVQMLSYFGPYAEAVKGRIADIEDNINKLDTRIEIAREDMRAAFSDLKKIEITQARRDKEALKELEKKETAELDEIGIETFRRQNTEG